jgi:hypothetical protein
MPTLTETGQEIYDGVAPLMSQDAANGFAGKILSGAFATMLDPAAYVARDNEDGTLPGWAAIFDVDNVQAQWLPWLSQFVGDSAAVQNTTDVAAQRTLIKTPVNFTRGRPSAIIAAAQTTLTGSKTVLLFQRVGGNPWAVSIYTYDTETANATATKNAILTAMPAWLVPTISVVTFGSYATVAASHATYTLMEAAHATYSDIPIHPAA